MKGLRDRKHIVHAAPRFEPAIHEFGLPFHEWKTALGPGAFPFVEKIAAVNLRARARSGVVRPESTGYPREHDLSWAKINRGFPSWNPDEIAEAANFTV